MTQKQNNMRMTPVILCGGAGTRLWPISNKETPKHLLRLFGENSLLQETIKRAALVTPNPPILICSHDHRFVVAEQVNQLDTNSATIIVEPYGRNTAAAICLAALEATKNGNDAVLMVMPADHLLENLSAFKDTVIQAKQYAEKDFLATLGVVATSAHTGYGYIKKGDLLGEHAYQVSQFIEKPNYDAAKQYQQSGYYWNSGMFVLKASTYLEELETFQPDILNCCKQSLLQKMSDSDFTRIDEASFKHCPNISIDYAVMEKTNRAIVLPLNTAWNDIGSWNSLYDLAEKDAMKNFLKGNVIAEKVSNSYLSASHRQLITIGLNNHIVVETKDAVLVMERSHTEEIKAAIQKING